MTEPMNIPQETKHLSELEKKLENFYNTITPEPAFVHTLDVQIAGEVKHMPAGRPGFVEWLKNAFQRRPALTIGITVLVVLTLAVTFAGPQQVLASVQRLLGFVPGSGFVQPGETRVLATPVEETQGEVTLRVEKVIAGAKQTDIVLTASGLPREKFQPQTGEQDPLFQAYILLPDGKQIKANMIMSGIGDNLQASYIFDPLPGSVTNITLVLPRLPGVPAGFAPENWSVPIQLVTAQVLPTGSPSDLLVATGYVPLNGLAQAKGVSVQVVQVAQAAQETGVQIQFQWDNPEWWQLNNVDLSLAYNDGQVYSQIKEPMQLLGAPESVRTYRFQPFESGASQALFTVDKLYFTFKSTAHFTFDPGKDYKVGQSMDLSSQPGSKIEIAGVPVQLLSAMINPGPGIDELGTPQSPHYHLELQLQYTEVDGLALENLTMSIDPELLISSSTDILPDNREKITIDLAKLPDLPLLLYFSYGEVSLKGPWVIQWDLPKK